MKIKFNKSDVKILVLFYMVAIPIILYSSNYDAGIFRPIAETAIYILFSLIALYGIVYQLFPRYFPKNQIIRLFIYILLFMATIGLIEIYLYQIVNSWVWKDPSPLRMFMAGLDSTLENAGILLGIFLGKKFFDTKLDLEKREKEKRENELRLLKSQIDPHFLFKNRLHIKLIHSDNSFLTSSGKTPTFRQWLEK
ncbi:MAG: histidine kinase [Saprospiraceae bacterium]|nr:histidine kinase [Bacteroidia bacterium]NNE15228.1 histidine kinase [Saprospiraceae bacterium]NNL93864.1 histidine kinase [Saprospiraceae bacterium]